MLEAQLSPFFRLCVHLSHRGSGILSDMDVDQSSENNNEPLNSHACVDASEHCLRTMRVWTEIALHNRTNRFFFFYFIL